MTTEIVTERFKPFWVFTINNYICDAAYNGKQLKEKYPFPSFRKFYFIRSYNDLVGFNIRDEITNIDLVRRCLSAP